MAIFGAANAALDTIKGAIGSTAWGPLVRLSRTAVLSLFRQIQKGQLVIRDVDGRQTICGKGAHNGSIQLPETTLTVLRESFWVRVAFFTDMVRAVHPLFVDKLLKHAVGLCGELYAGGGRLF